MPRKLSVARETITIPSDMNRARDVEDALLKLVAAYDFDQADQFAIKLALEECLVNAIKHGNENDRSKTVKICYEIDNDRASFCISDQGEGFCPDDVPDPTADENIERPCGRGLMLMRTYMDEVTWSEKGTCVHLVKCKGPANP
jgi:serine/threonine-protein kinase RsbW